MTLPTARLPRSAVIREVGLRDGLQSIATILPTAQKIEWIRAAYEAGQREIEVGSFVPARLLPQLADTAELVAFAKSLPSLFTSVLVPNLRGAESAIDQQRCAPMGGRGGLKVSEGRSMESGVPVARSSTQSRGAPISSISQN